MVFVMTSGSGLNLLNRPICVSTGGKGADKEVIQPQVPLRLPCYDFIPITTHTLGDSVLCRFGHRLRVQTAFMM